MSSLLLVKGDFIALKVGDTAPAKFTTVVTTLNADTDASDSDNASHDVIQAGERLTINSLSPLVRDTLALSGMSTSPSTFTWHGFHCKYRHRTNNFQCQQECIKKQKGTIATGQIDTQLSFGGNVTTGEWRKNICIDGNSLGFIFEEGKM